jgi:hypothetical protein
VGLGIMSQPNRSPADLPKQWRTEAEFFERHGASAHAATKRADAEDLESALRAAENQLLTREQAAERSGYAPDAITRLIRQGRLRNYGRPGSPQIRAGDLPRKTGRNAPAPLAVADGAPASARQVDAGISRTAVAGKTDSLHRRAST